MKIPVNTNKIPHFGNKIYEYFRVSNQWFLDTPERALDQAYKSALIIKEIEEEQFGGNKISAESVSYSKNVMSYWQADLKRNLNYTKFRLTEFKVSRSILNISNSSILEKLKLIDEIIEKYSYKEEDEYREIVMLDRALQVTQKEEVKTEENLSLLVKVDNPSDKTGVLPRSIGRTINRIKTELDPKAEEKVVKSFRNSRNKTKIAIRFILILVLIPFLTQQISKNFLISPIINRLGIEGEPQIFLNWEMKEEALRELQTFEEGLKFESLIYQSPQLSEEAIEKQVKDKAIEIAEEFKLKSNNAISNIFADLLALIAFGAVVAASKRDIVVLKSFMDDIVYGLSDSAKAFVIILFTDIFVGFHSPHGWEVVLEGIAEHLGIAASKSMISLFIATVPVILDTIFKYWIFRYLSRISPSAVATLRNMNE